MKEDTITKSANQVPLHTDWQRYETPAVVRKHGRQYLERIWMHMEGESTDSAISRIAKRFGAHVGESKDMTMTLLSFDDLERALACARTLREAGEALSVVAQLGVRRLP
jgi:hypothetical protein